MWRQSEREQNNIIIIIINAALKVATPVAMGRSRMLVGINEYVLDLLGNVKPLQVYCDRCVMEAQENIDLE